MPSSSTPLAFGFGISTSSICASFFFFRPSFPFYHPVLISIKRDSSRLFPRSLIHPWHTTTTCALSTENIFFRSDYFAVMLAIQPSIHRHDGALSQSSWVSPVLESVFAYDGLVIHEAEKNFSPKQSPVKNMDFSILLSAFHEKQKLVLSPCRSVDFNINDSLSSSCLCSSECSKLITINVMKTVSSFRNNQIFLRCSARDIAALDRGPSKFSWKSLLHVLTVNSDVEIDDVVMFVTFDNVEDWMLARKVSMNIPSNWRWIAVLTNLSQQKQESHQQVSLATVPVRLRAAGASGVCLPIPEWIIDTLVSLGLPDGTCALLTSGSLREISVCAHDIVRQVTKMRAPVSACDYPPSIYMIGEDEDPARNNTG